MKVCLTIFSAGLTLLFAAPKFVGPITIYDGYNPIDVGYYGAPNMADWDGNGTKDLIIGQYDFGYIRFYPNQNNDSQPTFNGFQYIYASGNQITMPYG